MSRKTSKDFKEKDSLAPDWPSGDIKGGPDIRGLEPNFEKRMGLLLAGLQREKEENILALLGIKQG
jgi:hypothetical protein